MKYLITISYDGSKYKGLQKLKNENTVQGELEKVLSAIDSKPVSVKAAGRTDRGVHALDQKCHFELEKAITPFRLRYYIDKSTSKYLYVKDCKLIEDENFHARFSVKSKTYEYRINTGEYDPINADYVYNMNKELNIEGMVEASKALIGQHNYKVFVTGPHKTYDSIIDYINIVKKDDLVIIQIKGKAFYTYMVRNIVSALTLIGLNKINKEQLYQMINKQERVIEYAPAPANGLYLKKIEY